MTDDPQEMTQPSYRAIKTYTGGKPWYVTNTDTELKQLVKRFFDDFLDYTEESDNGVMFHPIQVSCCRVMKLEPLNELLRQMKELANNDH